MENKELLKLIKELTEIIEQSGIELNSRDQLGNTFELCAADIAIMVVILVREDLTKIEKAMMLYGAIHSPSAQNFINKVSGEAQNGMD